MFTKDEIISQLNKFCVADGRPVIVHSSLKAIGEIDGGGETLLSALIEHFTQNNGLLCIPTHTWISMVLDLKNPESCLGVLPTLAARHPLGFRSLHPTHSMVVFGEKERAEKFLEREAFSDSPTNPDGCYGNIIKEEGFVLLLGVDHRKNTILHCIEEMLSIPGRLTDDMIEAPIIYPDGKEEKRKLRWFDTSKISDVSKYFGKFEPAFREHNCIVDGMVGNASSQFCSVKNMKETLEIIYKNVNGEEILADNKPLKSELYKFWRN